MDKKTQLARTCLACGTEKPLAAFLQISGSQGTVYGNICSSCRSAGAKSKTSTPQVDDERGGTSSGLKIDNKAKLQKDIDQQLLIKKHKELDLEEDQKLDQAELDAEERKEKKAKAEKDHRKGYIENKQAPGFLGYQPKQQTPNHQIATQKAAQEKSFIAQHEQIIEKQKLESALDQEFKQTTTDFSSGVSIDPALAGLRFQIGDSFLRLKTLLGKSAFLGRVENTFGAKGAEATPENAKPAKDPLVDYVKENLTSSSKRRGN
ncbi:MAG: hypothetical protein ACYCQI_11155 [Gammaproteobacteria bacterium]